MSNKTRITTEQLIARKGGWTTYINAAGTQVKARNSAVEVIDETESARVAQPKAKPAKPPREPRITRAGRVSEAREDLDADEEDDSEEGDGKRRIGNTRHDCSHYAKTKSAKGNKTLDSGDGLAVELRGMELEDVYARAAKELNESVKSLHQRYDALNPGMQRMNLGNRMRAALKKRTAVVADSAK